MTNLEIISQLKKSTFSHEDEESYQLEFHDGLSEAQLDTLAESFPNQTIDAELREILKITRGWEGHGLEPTLFDSIHHFGFDELSPYSITLGEDGAGNYWVLDINAHGKLGKVFYACHDPAVLVINSQSLNEFLHQLLELLENPEKCHINEVCEETVMTLWDKQPNFSAKTEFMHQHPHYNDFLNSFEDDEWTVADLRNRENKAGFAWGRMGPNQLTQRHPSDLIWVIKNKKKGFFSKLFGK